MLSEPFIHSATPTASSSAVDAGSPDSATPGTIAKSDSVASLDAAITARCSFSPSSMEGFTGSHSPYVLFIDPAFGAVGIHFAKAGRAGFQLRNYAGLRQGQNLRAHVVRAIERHGFWGDHQDGSRLGDHGRVHPPRRAVGVAYPPPHAELPHDLHGQALAAIDPEDPVFVGRSLPHKDLIARETGKTGHGRRLIGSKGGQFCHQ